MTHRIRYLTDVNSALSSISSSLKIAEGDLSDIKKSILNISSDVDNLINDINSSIQYYQIDDPDSDISDSEFDSMSNSDVEKCYDQYDSYIRLKESLQLVLEEAERIKDVIHEIPIDTEYSIAH